MDIVSQIIGQISAVADAETTHTSELEGVIRELLDASDDIEAALITSRDGHALAQIMPPGFDVRRFAAMSSALIALSTTFAREAGKGETLNVLIEGRQGNAYIMHAGNMVLTIFTKIKPNLGLTLAHARRATDRIIVHARGAAERIGQAAD